jgi:tetratricopeptide (TPR) repeat protein
MGTIMAEDSHETERLLQRVAAGHDQDWALLARHQERLRRMVALRLDRNLAPYPPAEGGGAAREPLRVRVPAEPVAYLNLEQLNRTLASDPRNAAAYEARGIIRAHRGEHELAVAVYRKALEPDPRRVVACNALAWLHVTGPAPLRNPGAAEPLARRAVELAPRDGAFLNTPGIVYYRLGRWREAVETLQQSGRRNEKQPDVGPCADWYFLAMSFRQLGQTARADEFYARALRRQRAHQEELEPRFAEELETFRAEATALLAKPPAP